MSPSQGKSCVGPDRISPGGLRSFMGSTLALGTLLADSPLTGTPRSHLTLTEARLVWCT